jgi:hypothetical protein
LHFFLSLLVRPCFSIAHVQHTTHISNDEARPEVTTYQDGGGSFDDESGFS